jgi:hypothetical protein
VLRYCIPRVRKRGYGLGNELIPWARAFLASQVLDARLVPPAFGLNRRGYWRHFGTSPDDWIYHRSMQLLLPLVEFNESDYLAHGGGDVVQALRSFAAANDLHRRRIFALVTDGMWGGYSHIQAARDFIRATLYQSRYAARNLLRLQRRIDPNKVLVGMHVRLGDFASPVKLADYRRAPNTSLPIEWFVNIADQLGQVFADDWQLLLVSDGEPEALQPLLSRHPCIITGDIPNGDCSDALALAQADLLVCSASSYSSLAATLSESPYIWFADNLYEHPEGCYSLHGDSNSPSTSLRVRGAISHYLGTARSGVARGIAVGADGKVPVATLDAAVKRRDSRRWELDLVRGGVTPMPVNAEIQVRRLSR